MRIESLSLKIIKKHMPVFIKLGSEIVPQRIQYWQEEHFTKDIKGKWEHSLVMFDDDNTNLLGFIIVSLKENNRLHINKMAVNTQIRSKGLGSILLSKLIENSKSKDISCISLFTHIENYGAYNFYKKHGFIVSEEITDTNNEKRYYMTLKL